MTDGLSASDVALLQGRSGNDEMFGNNGAWWIILFLIFGWGRNGYGGNGQSGAMDNYVLASDFATIQRQLSDGFNAQERKTDTIISGVCDLGYTQQSLANTTNMNVMQGNYNTLNAIQQNGYESRLATQTLGSQLANCCCDIREGIQANTTQGVMNTNAIQSQIAQCCCDNEKMTMQNRFDMAQYNCNTLQAIDKVGDRIIDYLANEKAQALRDENFALRLSASQERQNNFLIERLNPNPCPKPAYVVQPPQQVTFPTNCCGTVSYASNGCSGCGL